VTNKKKVIMFASKADENDKVQHYEVTKDTNGKLELHRCKSNKEISDYHLSKNDFRHDAAGRKSKDPKQKFQRNLRK
jgi:hypothetical protein